MSRHRVEVVAAFFLGVLLTFAAPALGGSRNCVPAWKCATAAPATSTVLAPTPTRAIAPTSTISARPFPAPVTTRTATASGDLNAFLAGQPDGTTILVPPGTYTWTGGVLLQNRAHLVIDGQGATVNLATSGSNSDPAVRASAFMLKASHDVWIRNFTIIGNNPDTTNVFVPGNEGQHVLSLNGWFSTAPSYNVEVSGVTASHVYGDGAYLEGRNGGAFEPSHHVWLHDDSFSYMGRNGVSSINASDILIERDSFDMIGMDAWDIEPNYAAEQVRRSTFRSNTVGKYGVMTQYEGWLLNAWSVPLVAPQDIVIADNVVSGNPRGGFSGTPRALHVQVDHSGRPQRITVTNNWTSQAAAGPVMRFVNVDGVTVTGNTQPLTSGSLASFSGCTGVTYQP